MSSEQVCSACKLPKDVSEFALKDRAKGTRSTMCKACHRSYSKAHYLNNRERYLANSKRSAPKARNRSRAFIIAYLAAHPCVDCGETDLDVLEFDHREMLKGRGGRVTNLTGNSLERIASEIAKCDVRCANCHTKRTRLQLGTSRYI